MSQVDYLPCPSHRKRRGRPPKQVTRPARELPVRPERGDTSHRRLLIVVRALLDTQAGVTMEDLMRASSLSWRQTHRLVQLVSELWPVACRADGAAGALRLRIMRPPASSWRPWPVRPGSVRAAAA